MQLVDRIITLILSGIMIIGVYQFYFFAQRFTAHRVKIYSSSFDEKIPFWPIWSWIYSFLYYPAILYLNWIIVDMRQFTMIALTFVCLMVLQMICFVAFPVATPKHWRSINQGKTASEKFLQLVQKYDDSSNCFPSMHISVSMLTSLFALPTLGPIVFLFPLIIGLSCLFTKQHYIIDLPFGALLGWLAYQIYPLVI